MLDVLSNRRRLRHGTRAFRRQLDVGEARIFVDHGFQWDGVRNVWITRARAPFVLGAGPQFRLRPRGFFERAIGWRRGRPSGDDCIDDFFVAHTDDADATWSALTTRARSLLARAFDDALLISDGHTVTLLREADFGREADAEAAAELVAEVVQFRARSFRALRSLPGAIYRRPTGDWESRTPPTISLHLPAAVTLMPAPSLSGAVLSVHVPCSGTTHRQMIDFGDPSSVIAGCSNLGADLDAITQLGLRRLTCDGADVTLTWPTLLPRRDRIIAASRFAADIAGNGQRALYR